MSTFSNEVTSRAKAELSDWIQIKDDFNKFTIEDFSYTTGVTQDVIGKHHCVTCTAINQCWFKNELDKKPVEFYYSNMSFDKLKGKRKGLYHFNCDCKKISIPSPKADDIQLIIPEGKVTYTVNEKSGWVKSMGYDDISQFIEMLKHRTK